MIRHLVAMLIAAVVVLAMAPAAAAQTDEELIRELRALREELRGQRFDQETREQERAKRDKQDSSA